MHASRCAMLGLLLIGTAMPVSPPAKAADPITVGTVGQPSANFWPVLIGISKGFFAAEDLNLDVLYAQSSAQMVQQITSGSLDVSISTGLVDPMRAIGMGAPIAIVRVEIQAPPYALLAKPSIKNSRRAQGQGHFPWRTKGYHAHLCGAHARAERSEAGRVRHGICRRHRCACIRASGRGRRCGDPVASVQLPNRVGWIQQPRIDHRLCQ